MCTLYSITTNQDAIRALSWMVANAPTANAHPINNIAAVARVSTSSPVAENGAALTTANAPDMPNSLTVISKTENTSPAVNDRRIGLVIGNSKYQHVPLLANPARDAAFVAESLKQVGFQEVDAMIAEDRDVSFEAVPLDQVLNAAERAKNCAWSYWMHAATIRSRTR